MDNSHRINQVAYSYHETFGCNPAIWTRAPGRVDLMGSHTDYNLGYVLTQAIDRDTWIAATPRPDGHVNLLSLNVTGTADFSIEDITYDETAKWSNYVRGVLSIFQDEGYPVTGFDALIHSTIPIGSGLSSSAAIEVATGVLLAESGGFSIDPLQLAILCQRAENDFVGMNCGILDQYSSVFGRAGEVLLLDCRDLSSVTRPIAPGIQLIICDTRAIRELIGSEYTERRAQCEQGVQLLKAFYPDINSLRDVSIDQLEIHVADLPKVVARRCRFVIEENQRVLDMADALADGNLGAINRLSADSFLGAQTLYEINSAEMDEMMAAMRSAPGVIGARQAGAGFGGCMAAFVESDCTQAFQWHVSQRYRHSTGIKPQIYPVQASSGAGILSL